MRVNEAIGGLAAAGVVVLVGLSLAQDTSPETIATAPVATILDPTTSGATTELPTSTTSPSDASEEAEDPENTADRDERATRAASTTTTSRSSSTTTTTTTLFPPEQRGEIELLVLNGGAGPGRAGVLSDLLRLEGFAPRGERDASVRVDQTFVLHAPGQELAAFTVDSFVGADQVLAASPDDRNWQVFGDGVDVLVILGPE